MHLLSVDLSAVPARVKRSASNGATEANNLVYTMSVPDIGLSDGDNPIPVFKWEDLEDFVHSTCRKITESSAEKLNSASAVDVLVRNIMSLLKYFCEEDPDHFACFEESVGRTASYKIAIRFTIKEFSLNSIDELPSEGSDLF